MDITTQCSHSLRPTVWFLMINTEQQYMYNNTYKCCDLWCSFASLINIKEHKILLSKQQSFVWISCVNSLWEKRNAQHYKHIQKAELVQGYLNYDLIIAKFVIQPRNSFDSENGSKWQWILAVDSEGKERAANQTFIIIGVFSISSLAKQHINLLIGDRLVFIEAIIMAINTYDGCH